MSKFETVLTFVLAAVGVWQVRTWAFLLLDKVTEAWERKVYRR